MANIRKWIRRSWPRSRCAQLGVAGLFVAFASFMACTLLMPCAPWDDLFADVPPGVSIDGCVSHDRSSHDRDRSGLAEDEAAGGLVALRDTYDRRMDLHREGREDLISIFRLQVIFLLLAFFVILRMGSTADFLGFKIPRRLLTLVVPAGLLYSWLHFGYVLNSLIDNRIILSLIQRRLEPGLDEWSVYSARHLLRDEFLLDAWFVVFLNPIATISQSHGTGVFNVSLMLAFGAFLAFTHGATIAVLAIGASTPKTTATIENWACATLMVVSIVFFFASHYQFYFTARHHNWLQALVLGVSVVIAWGLTLLQQEHGMEEGAEATELPDSPGQPAPGAS